MSDSYAARITMKAVSVDELRNLIERLREIAEAREEGLLAELNSYKADFPNEDIDEITEPLANARESLAIADDVLTRMTVDDVRVVQYVGQREGSDTVMTLFTALSESETYEFRAWARENYDPMTIINGVWHPVAQHECATMNWEAHGEKENS